MKTVKKDIRLISRSFMLCIMAAIILCGNTSKAENALELKASIEGTNSILLSWKAEGETSSYHIKRAESENGSFEELSVVSNQTGDIACYDNNVSFGNTYFYIIEKDIENVTVAKSKVVKVTVTLMKPDNVKVIKDKDGTAKISWNKVTKASNYTIYRRTSETKKYTKLATSKKNYYTDTSIKAGMVYYYKIIANKSGKASVKSNDSDIVVLYTKPEIPTVCGSYASKKIKLTWDKIIGAQTYEVYKKNSKGKYVKIGTTDKLYYKDASVKKGKSYDYKVCAVYNENGKTVKSSKSSTCKALASKIDPNKKMVALTFDDGPRIYTKDIVACLKAYNSKATFFVIGSQVDAHKSALIAANKIGCEIGNHTYTHANLAKCSESEIKSEISKTDKKIENAIGKASTMMRTPGGSLSNDIKKNVDKPIILWSIDTRDWETRNKDKTIKAVMNNVKDGDIVLMHDIYEPTKNAACVIIKRLNSEGYQLVTVSELAKYRGYTLKKGNVYHSLRKK